MHCTILPRNRVKVQMSSWFLRRSKDEAREDEAHLFTVDDQIERAAVSVRRPSVIVAILMAPFVLMLGLWLVSLFAAGGDADCTIGTVSAEQYRELYRQAKAGRWTVWPGLSNGIFWPSDRGLKEPSRSFEKALGERLLQAVDALSFDHGAADAQLAAAHAVMRSLGADYVSVFEIPDFEQNGRRISTRVQFEYFIAQQRFAPLCLPCFLSAYSKIGIVFSHDLAGNLYHLDHVFVLHGDLMYDPRPSKQRNVSSTCPAFPARG